MAKETLVVYNHSGHISYEFGWNDPADFERVRRNVEVTPGVIGAIVYEKPGEATTLTIRSVGPALAIVRKGESGRATLELLDNE